MNKLFLVAIGCMMTMSCSGSRPDNLGVRGGRLAECPDRPNCISSQATDKTHAIEPFTYEGSREDAFNRLKKAVASLKRTEIVEERDDYLRIECTSALFRFVDDVEFYFPEKDPVIQVRSASRLGYSDLGVNRKRVEKLRELFNRQQGPGNAR